MLFPPISNISLLLLVNTSFPFSTVTWHTDVFPSIFTVIIASPAFIPVTVAVRPSPTTFATDLFDDVHFTSLYVSPFFSLADIFVSVYVNKLNSMFFLLNSILLTLEFTDITVLAFILVCPSIFAVIVATPTPFAVTFPV